MATVSAGSSATFHLYPNQTVTVTSSPGAIGYIKRTQYVEGGSVRQDELGPYPTSHTFGTYGVDVDVELKSYTGEFTYVVSGNYLVETVSGVTKIGSAENIAAGHYLEVEADGTLRFAGDATIWRDIDFPIIIRTTGSGIPTLETITGNVTAPQWQVNDFNVCEGQEIVHGYKSGSLFNWHIHVITNGSEITDKFVKFEIEWLYANINGALSATQTSTSADLKIPADTATKTHLVFSIADVTLPTLEMGAHIWARLKRVTAAGTAPAANPWCSMLQMHVELDTIGSRLISHK